MAESTTPVSVAMMVLRDAVFYGRQTLTRRVNLTPSEYQEFLSKLEKDSNLKEHAQGIRYGYNSEDGILYVNTRSKMHDAFIEGLVKIFNCQLPEKRTGNNYEFVRGIHRSFHRLLGSSMAIAAGQKLINRGEEVLRFWHKEAGFPALVFEINFALDPRALEKAVRKYILELEGRVGQVMGFNFGHLGDRDREATVSLWRPKFVEGSGTEPPKLEVETVIDHRPFRTSDGTPVNGTDTIKIPLKSFAPAAIENSPPEVRDCEIEYTFTQFEKLLEKAELGYN